MVATTHVWIVVVILAAAGVGGVGFFTGYEYRGSPAAHSSSAEARTLSVLAAGSLVGIFPSLADALVNETPGITAPAASQTYEGSLDVTTAVSTLAVKADVAAVADYRLIPSLLEPKYANYEVIFGETPEVLVYNASISAFDDLTTSNWGTTLVSAITAGGSVAPFAVWNASTDPNGYNEIFDMMLQGMLYGGGDISQIYGHFYSGSEGGYATPVKGVTLIEHESDAATLIKTGVVSALITYRAYAIAEHLTYLPLDPIVGLASNNTTALGDYAKLSTEIISSSGSLVPVVPAPVLFAATVPLDAPNATLGEAFLHLLDSPQGEAMLSAGGAFTPIFPAWTDNPKAVPSVLAPDVTTMPTWASNLLT